MAIKYEYLTKVQKEFVMNSNKFGIDEQDNITDIEGICEMSDIIREMESEE